ncbi:MAG: TraB/GumN family protein, partial [Pseudomonadota bacterium]|nr:TraB/GumN family protein [Pseudomonadota bacterium]
SVFDDQLNMLGGGQGWNAQQESARFSEIRQWRIFHSEPSLFTQWAHQRTPAPAGLTASVISADERLDRPGTVLVAVGAGHFFGPKSVQVMLAERGLAAERLD